MPVLDWIGKKAVVNHHREVPYRLVHCDGELSAGDRDDGNLLVQGDNLEALKALLPYYASKVKCIYIDPPYNTGNEGWIYNDNVNSPEIKAWLGNVVGREAEDLSRHDKWLCMMYPRLRLLREFLREDGVILVSIDDAEVHHMRILLDEVFGGSNFIATLAVQKRYSRENRGDIGDAHEYVLIFARSYLSAKGTFKRVPLDEKSAAVYKNPNDDPKGRWRGIPLTAQAGHATKEQFYEITAPGGKTFVPPPGRCWGVSKATFEKYLNEDRIYFGKNNNSQPNLIRYLSEVDGLVPWTWWPHQDAGHTDEAKKEVMAFGLEGEFDTPKPTRLIKRLLQITTNEDDLIMDSFAGSGTTGHAVLDLNKQDEGNRKFILIEMEEKIAQDVTAERLKRVIDGYDKGGAPDKPIEGLGGGFRYCRLGVPLFNEFGDIDGGVTFPDLAAHVFFAECGVPIPTKATGNTPLLGTYQDKAVYLLFSPAETGFAREASGNVLTPDMLENLPKPENDFEGSLVVYGEGCTVSKERLAQAHVTFKQIPYQIEGA